MHIPRFVTTPWLAVTLLGCADSVAPTLRRGMPGSGASGSRAFSAEAAAPLRSRVAEGRCVRAQGSGIDAGAELLLAECDGSARQSFAWSEGGEITAAGLCVDAAGGSGREMDPIILWPCHGGANQRWTYTSAGEIRGVNDLCLDVAGASDAPGTRLILYGCHGGTNQLWDRDPSGAAPPPPEPREPPPPPPMPEPPMPPAAPDTVRIVTFGDSNTDIGWSGTDATRRVRAYVAETPENRLAPSDPHSELQLAGKIERRWAAARRTPLRAVNHAIAGTTTGGGEGGGSARNGSGSPNARTLVNGLTRFEGEVLGRGYPWHGGEPFGSIARVNAFTPDQHGFAYVSLGTNDWVQMSPAQTVANLAWMVETWTGAGLRADHFIVTTLAPGNSYDREVTPAINDGIRALAARTGVGLVDLGAHTSADGGRTWRSAELHVGDELHYAESVREWLAGEVVAYMSGRVP